MNALTTLIINRFQILGLLFLSLTLSVVLLSLRIKLNQSFFYLFLVWNLFLAVIPYAITTYIASKGKVNKFILLFWLLVWLLFLPNAPYIVTDLLHLRLGKTQMLWLDVLVVTSFALNGLILFFLSIMDFENILKKNLKSNLIKPVLISVFFLTGFGMYLGRFLRFNSWDIIQHPQLLINEIIDIIIKPNTHFEAWAFTLSFGVFLSLTYYLIKNLKDTNSPQVG